MTRREMCVDIEVVRSDAGILYHDDGDFATALRLPTSALRGIRQRSAEKSDRGARKARGERRTA